MTETLHDTALPGLRVEVRGGRTRVVLAGELDLATAGPLAAALDTLAPGRALEVDLSAVVFADCAGARPLVALARRAAAAGAEVTVAGIRPTVARVLTHLGLRPAAERGLPVPRRPVSPPAAVRPARRAGA